MLHCGDKNANFKNLLNDSNNTNSNLSIDKTVMLKIEDSDNTLEKLTSTYKEDNKITTKLVAEQTIALDNGDGTESILYFDDDGNIVKTLIRKEEENSDGTTTESYYDQNGELVEETTTNKFENNGSTGADLKTRILQACEAVTNEFLYRPGAEYSLGKDGELPLISGDIDKCIKEAQGICCATYVSMVLRVAGALTAEQINAYNYHWTGDGGVPSMLEAAGWKKLDSSQAQPGDVINHFEVHVMIYAGDGNVWDQSSCVGDRRGGPYPADISGYDVWRAPNSDALRKYIFRVTWKFTFNFYKWRNI